MEMFRIVSLRCALQPLRCFRDLRDTLLHISKYFYSLIAHLNLPCAGFAATEERVVWLCQVFHSTTLHSKPHIRHIAKARELPPLRFSRTLAKGLVKNKKVCKGSPRAVPCQGLSALRVRPIKISTMRVEMTCRYIFVEAYGSIFIGSALTSPALGQKKQSFFIFFLFFYFFFLFFFPELLQLRVCPSL